MSIRIFERDTPFLRVSGIYILRIIMFSTSMPVAASATHFIVVAVIFVAVVLAVDVARDGHLEALWLVAACRHESRAEEGSVCPHTHGVCRGVTRGDVLALGRHRYGRGGVVEPVPSDGLTRGHVRNSDRGVE